MKWRYLLFALFLWTLPALGQQVEIFGYFEPQFMGAKIGDEFYQLSSNKLRVDLQLRTSDRVSFGANFDYITYHGKTDWDLKLFMPENVVNEVSDINMFGYSFNPYHWEFSDRQFLDNAFVKFSFSKFDLTVGKQQISLGTGYVWNPVDVFNRKDIVDPTYEQPGHNAIRLDIPISSKWGITSIYAPTDNWKADDLLLKLKGNLGHFDFSILGIQKQWKFTDARIVDFINQKFYQLPTRRQILGFDFAGELFGLGVWGEAAHNRLLIENDDWLDYEKQLAMTSLGASLPMSLERNFWEWVVGADYTFDSQTYVMAEFYQNYFAKDDYNDYRFNDWMQYYMAETKTLSRDQCYTMIQHPVTDLLSASISGIYSFSDESSAVFPMIVYNLFEDVDLTFIGNFYLGKEGTAYAKNLGNGFMARAKVYF
ncbi:hypothetical protein B6D60_00635 [candidate division KSB1 bacterium 4484_87]|nr:MAG: hypothetical protein B6D60_00635 [candidate division KSB1 bacterium 4484_87]